ncbi:hypothetical protein [Enterobacter roggenkampii]|uniref:hypothetical protein n=1 Tax=Enterobacter roggenkampii TaxID=1812935 RepID=UPI001C707962|nr:hypothetical protein [Enterobacter roggenkampii]MBW9467658.1 hypothetical protein [Enterobacter roggenkampii]
MKYDYEQQKHIIEEIIENNFEKVKSLLQATYLDADAYADDLEELAEAVEQFPPADVNFIEWLLMDSPDLYAQYVQMFTTVLAVQNAFKQLRDTATENHVEEFLA